MKYIMKSGKLYLDGAMLIQCKSRRISPWKIICDKEGKELLYTETYQKNSDVSGISDMQAKESSRAEYRDISLRRYLLRKMMVVYVSVQHPFMRQKKDSLKMDFRSAGCQE